MYQLIPEKRLPRNGILMMLSFMTVVTALLATLSYGTMHTSAESTADGCVVTGAPDAGGWTTTIDCFNLTGDAGVGGDYPDEAPPPDEVGGGSGDGIEPPVYLEDDPPPAEPPANPTPTTDPLTNNCVDEFGVSGPCPGTVWVETVPPCDFLIVGAITCTIAEQFQPVLKLPCAFVKASATSCALVDRWSGD
jgi:hypothetical protein